MYKFRFSFFNIPLIRAESVHVKRYLSGIPAMRILNVAEKNDAAKNIAALLSSGSALMRNSSSKFNKIYEFEYELFGQNCKMIMTSVSGHLLNVDFVKDYQNWNNVNPISLFEAPIEWSCNESCLPLKVNLETEIKSCSKLIIWTDCDREGENIGFEIIEVCKAVKPKIDIYRAKFSEISQQSVKRALANLGIPNKHVSDAVNVRRELDLRIGAAFTRFQTLFLRKAFPDAMKNNIVSYGSCQFPTLGFVVERFKEISEFIPERFWVIKVTHTLNNLTVEFFWERSRLFDKLSCEVLYEKCLESGVAKVEQIDSKPKIKWRPRPLDTVELEKKVSQNLRINAKETLKIAEILYTQGLISYPRTETTIFPKELNLVPFVQCQTEDPQWGGFAEKILTSGLNPFQGNKTDHAHPPIYPIKYSRNLTGREKAVYEYIVRHFLACLSSHAQGLETTVEVSIADEKFTAKGLMITAKNYLEVYPYEKWSDKELHVYSVGSTFNPKISLTEGETSPPELLTEADLIALMNKHGIGTDATHAEHIETIKARLYVGLQKNKYFVPRTLGMGLIEGYINMGYAIAKPELRAYLEADLKRVSENKKSPEEVLVKHLDNYKKVFEGVQERVNGLLETLKSYFQVEAVEFDPKKVCDNSDAVMKCPECGSHMRLKSFGTNKKFLSCSNFPRCHEALWFPSNVEDATVTSEACSSCGPDTRLVKFKFSRGTTFLPSNYVGCLRCNFDLLEVLNVTKQRRNQATRPTTLGEINDSGFASLNESSPGGSICGELSSPKCHCGFPAVRLRAMKSDVNFGRFFYKCQTELKCNFFQWDDEGGGRTAPLTGSTLDPVPGGDGMVRCYCAQPCQRMTVVRDGPNKGRPYYKCSGSSCQFFKWADNQSKRSETLGNRSRAWNPHPRNGVAARASKKENDLPRRNANRKK